MKNISIASKLIISFTVLIIIAGITSVTTIHKMKHIGENLNSLYNHPYKVSNALRDINNGIITIHRDMKDVVLSKNELERQRTLLHINEIEADVYNNFKLVKKRYLGDFQDVVNPERTFKEWKYIRDEVVYLVQNGRLDEASEITKGSGYNHINKLSRQMDELLLFADTKAAQFYTRSNTYMQKAFLNVSMLFSFLVIISVLIWVILAKSISSPLKSIIHAIQNIREGRLDEPIKINSRDEIGKLAVEFIKLQKGLIHKSQISDAIAVGNFENLVEPSSPHDRLAFSINQIANNFKAVVEHAENIANGKYNLSIKPKSDKDQLGIALKLMTSNLLEVIQHTKKISEGNYEDKLRLKMDEDELAVALNKMTESLKKSQKEEEDQNRIQSTLNELNTAMQGDYAISKLAKAIIKVVAKSVNAQIGAFYIRLEEHQNYQLLGSYAFNLRKELNSEIAAGQGIAGQAIVEKQLLSVSEVPDNYFRISSTLGESAPKYIVAIPIVQEDKALGVIELGSFFELDEVSLKFLNEAAKSIASRLVIALNKDELKQAFLKTQEQSEELQVQQEELRQINKELEEQAEALKTSEAELQRQQEELRVINEDLEEKTGNLMEQKAEIEKSNHTLQLARTDLEQKAKELENASKYKSEFLANMSHELRTPLNSLLILSQTLQENKKDNLTKEQIESLEIIYDSGKYLLNLINEILDLSKIEAGKMEVNLSPIVLKDFTDGLHRAFNENVKEKGIDFNIRISSDVPNIINTDDSRINQVLRNLIGNAIKFTKEGSVDLIVRNLNEDDKGLKNGLSPENAIAFEVIDTGIGIPEDKTQEIFEAFQQVDGSITREYGGTGLGLSITREIMSLLDGEVKVKSTLGKGSVFTVYIPTNNKTGEKQEVKTAGSNKQSPPTKTIKNINENKPVDINPDLLPHINDDRDNIKNDDRVILVVEDDLHYAKILYDACHVKNFMCIASPSAEEASQIIHKQTVHAILLDLGLPGMSGEDFFHLVKNNIKTRHIPIHIITGADNSKELLNKGVVSLKRKPVYKTDLDDLFDDINLFILQGLKNLLVVEDNEIFRNNIVKKLESSDICINEAKTGKEAIQKIEEGKNDCVILDIGLPDITGFEVLSALEQKKEKIPPIIIYTGKELTKEENELLHKHSKSVIIKGIKSEERLIDEVALFLHRVVKELPDSQKKLINRLYSREEMFKDKKVLIIDDDIRNVFALTKLFEENQMKVLRAENGAKGLEVLDKEESGIDIVLLDIMMPVMNGFETIKNIRKQEKLRNLPVIAVTAKAMRADRDDCIKAGVNDYVTKPIDIEKLFSLMRLWLYR